MSGLASVASVHTVRPSLLLRAALRAACSLLLLLLLLLLCSLLLCTRFLPLYGPTSPRGKRDQWIKYLESQHWIIKEEISKPQLGILKFSSIISSISLTESIKSKPMKWVRKHLKSSCKRVCLTYKCCHSSSSVNWATALGALQCCYWGALTTICEVAQGHPPEWALLDLGAHFGHFGQSIGHVTGSETWSSDYTNCFFQAGEIYFVNNFAPAHMLSNQR